ncbi:hypothetical protein GGR54DRAFT_640998 [Hypoxylon sp. NC1633]|nr:hypothetical protein GGR54DRAFT_640998 [Hypoxylon sp. NC1633]
MPPLDVDSQFRFLIACIKHSSAGKVDFNEVAKECDIVTKGAAAKRYERLMKAHGITPPGATGGLKKEAKDSKDGIKSRANKKRKLAAVDEDAGDVDEPVKTEIKGEVKTEDLINVKAEQENGGGATAAVPSAPPVDGVIAPIGQPTTISPSTNAQNEDDDDDEVLVISATEKRDDGSSQVYGDGAHHHLHSHSHSPAPMIPGIHSFDYAANMGFPQQMNPTRMMSSTRMTASHNSIPYGFPPSPWMYPHDTHGYL